MGECTTPDQAGMGVSRETIGSGREQGHDSRKIRHGGERSYHWGFWREHARGGLKTRKDHEILKFLSPCWEKRYMARVFYARDTIVDAFVQELLHMTINLLLAYTWSTPDNCLTWVRSKCSVEVWKHYELTGI